MQCEACGRDSTVEARFCSQCGARLGTAGAQTIPVEARGHVMSDLRGEERLVTVVFADMTESVRRTSGLSGEEATMLVNPLLETMVELMVRYGGRIDRFLGDGILAVFGVPSAHEDDPIRAVRAALELRERSVDLGLAITVGINTGRVYFGPIGSSLHKELTVMGPTVNLAARFQSAAAAGEILIGRSTNTHVHAAFALTPVTLTVKGISEPVEAFKAERLLDNPSKVRGIEGLRAQMVGRDVELRRLQTAFPKGETLALVGPAGVGKSRLASEFWRHVMQQGGAWMEGRCLELTEGVGYGPFLDLFQRHLGTADQLTRLHSSLRELIEAGTLANDRALAITPFLANMLGLSLGDDRDLQVIESSAEQRQTLTVNALVEYLSAKARLVPLVVFLDDIHWSDRMSLEAIRRLHERQGIDSLMLLLAYRPLPETYQAAWRGPEGSPPFQEIPLRELSRTESRHLISMLLEISGIPQSLEQQILDHGHGNPFYVEELIRSLIQKGAIARDDGRWYIAGPDIQLDLPESVEGVLMSRFDRLPEATRRAAKAASVLDRTFTEPVFAAIAGDALVPELETLVGAGITMAEESASTRSYAFVHALTRQAIYTNLLPSHKADLHERAAATLEQAPTFDVNQIAYHYQRSRNHPKAVEYLLKAADQALESFTTDTARQLLDRGLQRVDDLPESDVPRWRGRYRARLGELQERMAQHVAARADLEAALAEMEPDPLEEAHLRKLIGQTYRLEANFDAAHRAYDQAEEVLARWPGTDFQQAWIEVQKERAFALYFGGRGKELPTHNTRVGQVVERYGTAAQQADHLYGQVLSSFVRDRFVVPSETVAMARKALHLAEAGADPGRVAEGRFVLGFSLLWADQLEEAAAVLEKAVEETSLVGAVTEACRARAYRAVALRRLARVEEAAYAAGEALEAARHLGSSYYAGHAQAVLCWVAWRRGSQLCDQTGEEAYDSWGRHEDQGRVGLDCEFGWLAAWPLAAAAFDRGNHSAMIRHLEMIRTPWERPLPPDLEQLVDEVITTGDPVLMAEVLARARSDNFL